MADEQQVPPPAGQSADRIQQRPAEGDFARLPDNEVHSRTEPGAGPYGSTATGGINAPIVVMAVGALIAASVFVFRSFWVLLLGGVVFLAAAIWAGVAGVGSDSPGHNAGSDPTMLDPQDD